MSRASYGWDAEGNLTNGNTYIAGTIRIHNGTDEDASDDGTAVEEKVKKRKEMLNNAQKLKPIIIIEGGVSSKIGGRQNYKRNEDKRNNIKEYNHLPMASK